MSRQEIGSYLGLALETVSRLFTRFQDEKILKVERKHVQILDMERLRAMVTHQTNCERHSGKTHRLELDQVESDKITCSAALRGAHLIYVKVAIPYKPLGCARGWPV